MRSRRAGQANRAERSGIWLVAFALTGYLGLSGGGYDLAIRSQVGLVVWWLVLLGVILGLVPRSRLTSATWVGFALLSGFFAWTWLGATWTPNTEQTLAEVGRVATYAGVFVLAAAAITGPSARTLLGGLASGIAVVCALAVLSKLVPSFFPTNPTARVYLTPRLSYPFDYSDGVGEFAALGIPLLWHMASSARTLWGRGLGGAGLPVVLLCLGMTVSRGGILAAVVGGLVFLALSPDRLPRLASGLIAALATAALMAALLTRHALAEGLNVAPAGQRHSMLVIVIVVVALAALLQAALAMLGRTRPRPEWTRVSRATARGIWAAIAVIVVAGLVAFFATGAAHRLWEEFKQPNVPTSGSTYFRLLSVAGSHRYQYWQVALHAFSSSPWHGIGPGTFQFYWAQHQKLGEYVVNAHSLWIETLAELGIVGLVLLAGFFLWTLVGGAIRALGSEHDRRALRITAVSGVAAFCAAAAFDWDWQIAVIPMITMMLAAVALSRGGQLESDYPSDSGPPSAGRRLAARAVLCAASLVALWTIIVPLGTTTAVRASQSAAARGQFGTALRDAADAQQLESGAASPRLQKALVLEQLGDVSGAAQAIAEAVRRGPTNWELWLVASRIATEQDRPALALSDYRKARSLNPRSPIFSG